MKKWMYLIFPGAMLGLFLVFYFSHQKESEVREASRQATIAKKKAEDDRQKQDAENRARADAAKKQAEREAEEKKKDEDRRAKQAAIDKQIKDETAAAIADADKLHKEVAALQIELDRLQKERDAIGRQAFDAARQVEGAKVERRNAEMESQRVLEMIVKRAAESSLTRLPPPPSPPAPAK